MQSSSARRIRRPQYQRACTRTADPRRRQQPLPAAASCNQHAAIPIATPCTDRARRGRGAAGGPMKSYGRPGPICCIRILHVHHDDMTSKNRLYLLRYGRSCKLYEVCPGFFFFLSLASGPRPPRRSNAGRRTRSNRQRRLRSRPPAGHDSDPRRHLRRRRHPEPQLANHPLACRACPRRRGISCLSAARGGTSRGAVRTWAQTAAAAV